MLMVVKPTFLRISSAAMVIFAELTSSSGAHLHGVGNVCQRILQAKVGNVGICLSPLVAFGKLYHLLYRYPNKNATEPEKKHGFAIVRVFFRHG